VGCFSDQDCPENQFCIGQIPYGVCSINCTTAADCSAFLQPTVCGASVFSGQHLCFYGFNSSGVTAPERPQLCFYNVTALNSLPHLGLYSTVNDTVHGKIQCRYQCSSPPNLNCTQTVLYALTPCNYSSDCPEFQACLFSTVFDRKVCSLPCTDSTTCLDNWLDGNATCGTDGVCYNALVTEGATCDDFVQTDNEFDGPNCVTPIGSALVDNIEHTATYTVCEYGCECGPGRRRKRQQLHSSSANGRLVFLE